MEWAELVGMDPRAQLTDECIRYVWEMAVRHDAPIVIDVHSPFDPSYQYENLETLAESYPDLRIVIVHLAYAQAPIEKRPEMIDKWVRMITLAQRPNVWIDFSGWYNLFPQEEYPYPTWQTYLKRAYELVSAMKLLWGSDMPDTLYGITLKQCLDQVRRHCSFLSDEEKELILGANALDIFRFER